MASKDHQKIFNTHYRPSLSDNKLAFNRKKGKLAELLDKNTWMGDNYKVIGKKIKHLENRLITSIRSELQKISRIFRNVKFNPIKYKSS